MKSKMSVNEFGSIKWLNEKGEYHREDGPAYQNGHIKTYWVNGQRHREDGPAYINEDYSQWWLNNEHYTEEEHKQLMRLKKIDELRK